MLQSWAFKLVVGQKGGMLVLWNAMLLESLEEVIHQFSITIKFKCENNGFAWYFTCVYGPVQYALKRDTVSELNALSIGDSGP